MSRMLSAVLTGLSASVNVTELMASSIQSALIFLREAKGSFGYMSTAHLTVMNVLNSRHFATGEVVHSASRNIDRQRNPEVFAKS